MATSILDDAELRATTAAKTKHADRQLMIDSMRDEIGHPLYTQTKGELPTLERFIAQDIRPWLARIAGLQKGATPLRWDVLNWLTEMQRICDMAPNAGRQGLDQWEHLTPPMTTDGHSQDLNARTILVHGVRTLLRSPIGQIERIKVLKAQVEQFIAASAWPGQHQG